jgi:hypothetical protein
MEIEKPFAELRAQAETVRGPRGRTGERMAAARAA